MSRIALIEDSLGDAIALELSIDETAPGKARFQLKQNLGVTDAQWETDTPRSTIGNTAAEFMEAFVPLAKNAGYRLIPEDGGAHPNLACEVFDTQGKPDDQIRGDFEQIIRSAKNTVATARAARSRASAGAGRSA